MTRAQERLVLVGTCKQKQAKSWRALPSPGNSPVAFGSASNMLQWLLPLVDISSGKLELKVAKVEAEDEQASTVAAAEAPHADDDGPRIWNYSYPFREMTHRCASNSVTGLSKGDEVPTDTPDVTDEAPSGAAGEEARERGVAVHLFMEQFDFAAGAPGPADQLKSLVERGIMSQRQAELVDTSEVEWMLSEPSIAELLRSAQAIVREIPMLDSDPAGTAEFDRVLVRGRIDAVVQTPDGLVVIDYKTDRHFPEDGSQRQQAYRKQMELYRSAIERSGLGRVAGVKLVFLHARRVLEL